MSKWPNFSRILVVSRKGTNRLPLVHVIDAARAIVHLAGLPRKAIVGHLFIAMDGADTTQRELINDTAMYLGVKKPGTAPAWLAALLVGPISVETITFDAQADNSSLRETGFPFPLPIVPRRCAGNIG